MPKEYLKPEETKADGLAFIGLSLSRFDERGHPDSITLQTSFDLNLVCDRDYKYIMSSNDDGWLVGGGEPGPPKSYKLPAKDSSHVEIMQIGTYEPSWGGVSREQILELMNSGKILIPQIEVCPTAVVANPDTPPELEIRFDMEPWVPSPDICSDMEKELPLNWCLRFIHNQLFKALEYPARFCPGPFHSTILRKADWRSPAHKKMYFDMCEEVVQQWKKEGAKPLNTCNHDVNGEPLVENPDDENGGNNSGLWLFTHRNEITHFFPPNFLPPYNTPEKRKIIYEFIKEEWDVDELKWIEAGSKEKNKSAEKSSGLCFSPSEMLESITGSSK